MDFQSILTTKEYKKFENVLKYFEGISEDDLLEQDIWDYVDYAEPKHKGLVEILIRKYLEPWLEKLDAKRHVQARPGTNFFERNAFNGRARVLPSKLSYLKQITAQDLVNMECNVESVQLIDLSDNNISDTDFDYIFDFIMKLYN